MSSCFEYLVTRYWYLSWAKPRDYVEGFRKWDLTDRSGTLKGVFEAIHTFGSRLFPLVSNPCHAMKPPLNTPTALDGACLVPPSPWKTEISETKTLNKLP